MSTMDICINNNNTDQDLISEVDISKSLTSIESKWRRILLESPGILGIDKDSTIDNLPPWIDSAKMKRSQSICFKYYNIITFSSGTGTIMHLQLPLGTIPLCQTGRSASISNLFSRYFDTGQHVKKWYQHDLLDKESEGFKSLNAVRTMHSNIVEKMKEIPVPDQENKKKVVWVSQYNMMITQWAFVGLFMMFPQECGLSGR